MQTKPGLSQTFGLRIGSIEGHGRKVRNGGDTDQVLCLLPILSKIDLYPGGKI